MNATSAGETVFPAGIDAAAAALAVSDCGAAELAADTVRVLSDIAFAPEHFAPVNAATIAAAVTENIVYLTSASLPPSPGTGDVDCSELLGLLFDLRSIDAAR
jgi:hypothetical protein